MYQYLQSFGMTYIHMNLCEHVRELTYLQILIGISARWGVKYEKRLLNLLDPQEPSNYQHQELMHSFRNINLDIYVHACIQICSARGKRFFKNKKYIIVIVKVG